MTSLRYTRQQDRAEMRSIAKELRQARKLAAAKKRRPGGAAATK